MNCHETRRLRKVLQHLSSNPTTTNSSSKSQINHQVLANTDKHFDPLSRQYPKLVSKLRKLFPNDRYTEDKEILNKHGQEVIGFQRSFPPQAVIFPLNTNEISELCKICNNHKPNPIPIVAYSAGTSLESHIIPHKGGIIVSFIKMDKIIEFNPNDMQITVEPGVNWTKLNKFLAKYDDLMISNPNQLSNINITNISITETLKNFKKLSKSLKTSNLENLSDSKESSNLDTFGEQNGKLFVGVDPSPSAFIGGMCGTCCSGPLALKYGTMRDQVLNMRIILPNGNIFSTNGAKNRRPKKSVAGYNINSLFIGNEGTLGIITLITLKLHIYPKYIEIGQALFNNLNDIGNCVYDINKCGMTDGNLMAMEYLDNIQIDACNKYNPNFKLTKNKHIIIFKFGGITKEHIINDIKIIKLIVNKYTNIPFIFSKNAKMREKLWNIRKMAFWANKFFISNCETIVTDVAIPISLFGKCLTICKLKIDELTKKYNIYAPIIGHIGDGNFHCCILFDNKNIEQVKQVKYLCDFIVNTALKFDGTCTAEHGVGIHKKKYLSNELGNECVNIMKMIKQTFDPNNTFNPGKMIDI